MKSIISTILALCLLLCACTAEGDPPNGGEAKRDVNVPAVSDIPEEDDISQDDSADVSAVEMFTQSEEYPIGAETVTVTVFNRTDETFVCRFDYGVEHLVGDVWEEVPLMIEFPFAEDEIAAGESMDFKIQLLPDKIDYEPGLYRVCKSGLTAEFSLVDDAAE